MMEKLSEHHFEQGWALIKDRFYFLQEKGIDQYPSLEYLQWKYSQEFERGKPFGILRDSNLLGMIVLFPNYLPEEWTNTSFDSSLWISCFFTTVTVRGVGATLLENVVVWAKKEGYTTLLLDCYMDGGFLETYYQSQGFETVETKQFTYGERSFTYALMKQNLIV